MMSSTYINDWEDTSCSDLDLGKEEYTIEVLNSLLIDVLLKVDHTRNQTLNLQIQIQIHIQILKYSCVLYHAVHDEDI